MAKKRDDNGGGQKRKKSLTEILNYRHTTPHTTLQKAAHNVSASVNHRQRVESVEILLRSAKIFETSVIRCAVDHCENKSDSRTEKTILKSNQYLNIQRERTRTHTKFVDALATLTLIEVRVKLKIFVCTREIDWNN